MDGSDECVKVAVNIRPLITPELLNGSTDCVSVTPGEPQVQIGSHVFTYDHVYGSSGTPSSFIFEQCALPLIDALFKGYNATVLAYGQTGSGKTYTMGTNYSGESNTGGIIPKVMETIFHKVDALKENTEFLIRVSFIEIFKEEVFDLLEQQSHGAPRFEAGSTTRAQGLHRVPIQIRETPLGGITLAGVSEPAVKSKEEMASFLARGSMCRATASTHMNSQSSRSHAIFTISIEQKKIRNSTQSEVGDDILISKLHLVDLAGSERAKRTGADGLRLKEGIHINRGLLALGNVISALGDEKKRKDGAFVPYRDSKLTRLLQDSLGGNSKTAMIACISPADCNAEETINTLKYANRARNIQNKAVINRDPVAAEMQRMRSQLEQLQAELLFSRTAGASLEEIQILQQKVSLLEMKNEELSQQLKETHSTCDHMAQKALDAQVEKDQLMLKIELARGGKSWDEIDMSKGQEVDLMKSYLARIQQLESELRKRQSVASSSRSAFLERLELEKDEILDDLGDGDSPTACVGEVEEKEKEHSSIQDQLDKELKELDKRLEQKEAEMKQFARGGDTSVLKQHYEKKLQEMEQEKKALQKEIEDLRSRVSHISSNPDESSQRLKQDYLQRVNTLEAQVSELKKKQEAQAQLLRQKQKSDEAARHLQEEIQRIRSQKVQLQHKIKHESEQFRAWKASREKEVLQLKKEGRRNEYEMHKLQALNQRQKMVLQRKTEEAAMATKRLKELLDAKKVSNRDLSANGPGIQALMQSIEHELEVIVRVHEVRAQYDRQMQERAAMSKEIARLKEEQESLQKKIMSKNPQTMSPSARSKRISALENMLQASSGTLVSMASQLSEAEERERGFAGKGRWNQIRSLPEAKNIMNFLFNLASTSRCQWRDKEAECREKDSHISELKEKVVRLSGAYRQLEARAGEFQLEILHLNEQLVSAQNNQAELMDQMNSSEKEESGNDMELSDMDEESDSECQTDYEPHEEEEESDWPTSIKKTRKKSNRSTMVPSRYLHSSLKPDRLTPAEEVKPEKCSAETEQTGDVQCCTCSKSSTCRTKKCQCRALGKDCGLSCGCTASKCANRAGSSSNLGFIRKERGEDSGVVSDNNEEDQKKVDLVSQGTMLLESALKSGLEEQREKPRRPLGDIGNTNSTEQTGAKPRKRKNWGRKVPIQLVPTVPTATGPMNTVAESTEADAPSNRENIPSRLPRAMALPLPPSSANGSNLLADINGARTEIDEPASKDNGRTDRAFPPRSPVKFKRANEKENELH
ncbi:hypothetical protein LUZ60_000303 [Juncus effusus]|nr:hypothetical protein LUZ60_000303 [Juncus effusus]